MRLKLLRWKLATPSRPPRRWRLAAREGEMMTLQQMYTEDRCEVCRVSWPPVKMVERPEKYWRVRTEPISESLLKEIEELGRNFIVGEYTLHNLLKVEWWPFQPSDEEYAAHLMFADCLGNAAGRDDDA